MKQKEPFTLYLRKYKNGKKVYYYRFYDENEKRTAGKSTGQTSKTAARNYVIDLIRNNSLLTEKDITFEAYAKDWWIWDKCEYIKMKRARGQRISQSHAKIQRGNLEKHILPFFKSIKLRNINTKLIEKWLLSLHDTGKLSTTTINHNLATLKVMLKEARRLGYIATDPSMDVSRYAENPVKKEILSIEQVKELFKEDNFKTLWKGNRIHYTLNLLAASTGMRMGEIQGLKVKAIHNGYIEIIHAWERGYGLKEPKYGSFRFVTIPSRVEDLLNDLIQQNKYNSPEDLVFYGKERDKPIYNKTISEQLYKALEGIGVKYEKGFKRTITFHSWRHFFNTVMRDKISNYKLQQLTGHRI